MKIKNSIFIAAFVALGFAVACSPDEVSGGNPTTGPELDAAFTTTSTEPTEQGQTVTATASSNDDNIHYHMWIASNANGEYANTGGQRGTTATFTFNEGGTYKIKHTVAGYVGGNIAVSEKTIVVDLPLPEFGPNLVQSPNFETASDWTIFHTGANTDVNWTINENSATANGGSDSYPGAGIYQAFELEEGEYMIDMHISGDGSSLSWFRVYLDAEVPVDGSDYSQDEKTVLGLSTWEANCANNNAFDGQLAEIQCVGTGNPVTIPSAGTYYLVIKTGSGAANGVNNITISDVNLKKVL
ncbi:hypothetical protein [Flavobacterium rhizosphaerae]|uniref:PKD/Chitinase domain-containing protein n=1 Tax=Flavobacterium rhizosphaerae TaxID=3163298 RepID=A0ABW8Z0Z5_9FLAO